MKASEKSESGWIKWKPIRGTLSESDYYQIEKDLGILFPKTFISWHQSYYFLDGDCSIIRLPASNPNRPLDDLKQAINWSCSRHLISSKIYPFADEGNDIGPLVFDGRMPMQDNEFPIRVYDHEYGGDLDGLSEIIFTSFSKLLECVIHYLTELKTRKNFEIIPDFFEIDREGAGRTGVDYWLSWVEIQKTCLDEFGQ
ncbi:MAG: hypothetical protein RIE59_20830 [Imperialibacter sp.]